jgi:hypothetical protein
MSDPTSTPMSPERIRKVAAGVRLRVGQTPDASARIGRYRAADGREREVIIVRTRTGDWEVRDRGTDEERPVENLGTALQDAVALAVEYRRDSERRAVRDRALLTARDTRRLRMALAEIGCNPASSTRRAA